MNFNNIHPDPPFWSDFGVEPDRDHYENGSTYYGFDNDNGTTDWYTSWGDFDCTLDTDPENI